MKTPIILIVVVVMVLISLKAYRTLDQQASVPNLPADSQSYSTDKQYLPAVKKSPPADRHLHKVAVLSVAIYSSENLHTEPPSEKYRYKSLQLYPIYASTFFLTHHHGLGPYLSLQEAMDQKKIVITELTQEQDHPTDTTVTYDDVDDGAEVNRLFVENISSDTIIILGGEVVRGGKQDRMIAQDFMVLPHSGKVDIAVYCVEHGRWAPTGETIFFSVAMDVAPNKIRKATKADAAQEKVWEEVEILNEDVEAHAPTEALASAMDDVDMSKSIQPYKEHLESINWPKNVVGVVAVMGNEIVGLDIFAQHQLFKKYYPNLLSSYCSDAYETRNGEMMSYDEVQSFLTTMIGSDNALDNRVNEQGTQLKHNGFRIHVAAFGD